MSCQISVFVPLVFTIHFAPYAYSSTLARNITKTVMLDFLSPSEAQNLAMILDLNEKKYNKSIPGGAKVRRKRQGAGKFIDASKMTATKVGRLYGQMFGKNMVSSTYVGGPHPLHAEIPKAFVELIKEKFFMYFFPEIEADKTA